MKHSQIKIFLLVLFLLSFVAACSGRTTVAPTVQKPIADSSIESTITKYRQDIQRVMKRENISGLAIAVVDDQGILWAEGFGYTDHDQNTPVTPSTLFSIQSMSKSFTATAAMMAAQEGLVDLDAPISSYLPDFKINSIFEAHPEQKITLRMLLSHTAGFAHEAPYGGNFTHPKYSFEKHIASISDTWLMFPVGTHYYYSNLGVDLAGYILSVRAGMPFIQYVQEQVFQPLGMTVSTLDVARIRAIQDRAIGHNESPFRLPVDMLIIPSGGVWTSAEDMARYLQFHINKGALEGNRLLEEALAETMYTPPNEPARNAYSNSSYALGITVKIRNKARNFQHGGGGFGFNSSMIWYPELKLGAVVILNEERDDDLVYQINEEVLDHIIARARDVYDQRAADGIIAEPAYPRYQGKTVLSDAELERLIGSMAIPPDADALKRREAYEGLYQLNNSGIPGLRVEISNNNGQLFYTVFGETKKLTEVQPGLLFTPSGDLVDMRGSPRTILNVRVNKIDSESMPYRMAFNGLCGLIFFVAIFFWPTRAVIRRIRRQHTQQIVTDRPPQKSRSLVWGGTLAVLASIFSLGYVIFIALVPDLVYSPWLRPYADMLWWQFCVVSLPYTSLVLAVVVGVLAGVNLKSRALTLAARIILILDVLALFTFNWFLIT